MPPGRSLPRVSGAPCPRVDLTLTVRLEEFLRRSAGLDIDKSDMERLIDLTGRKLNDLLVIAVRSASYNNRDIIAEPDLPLTKGLWNARGISAAMRPRST